MEVLFVFLKWVASFAHNDEETGSKMDLGNLATVICPSILSARGKDAVRDETFSGLRVVQSLLESQDKFFTVPEDFLPLLHDQEYFVNSMELPSKDFLKKCDTYMRLKSGRLTPGTPYLGPGNGQIRPPPSTAPNSPPPPGTPFSAPDRTPRIPQNGSYPSSPNMSMGMGQSQGMMQTIQQGNPYPTEDWNPSQPQRPNTSSGSPSRPSSFVGPRSLPDSNQLGQTQGLQFNPVMNGYPSSAGRQRL
jgi:hypothetical protein